MPSALGFITRPSTAWHELASSANTALKSSTSRDSDSATTALSSVSWQPSPQPPFGSLSAWARNRAEEAVDHDHATSAARHAWSTRPHGTQIKSRGRASVQQPDTHNRACCCHLGKCRGNRVPVVSLLAPQSPRCDMSCNLFLVAVLEQRVGEGVSVSAFAMPHQGSD